MLPLISLISTFSLSPTLKTFLNEADRKISLSIKAVGSYAASQESADRDEVPVDIDAMISAQGEDDSQ